MEKYTKEEIKENNRKIAAMVNSDVWPLVKEVVDAFVLESEREIIMAPAEQPDRMLALANKLKFGTGSLVWFIKQFEKIRDGLDK